MDGVRHWSPGSRAFLAAAKLIRDILKQISKDQVKTIGRSSFEFLKYFPRPPIMRALILSDIHANMQALAAVLAAAPEHDIVWNLGDVVG